MTRTGGAARAGTVERALPLAAGVREPAPLDRPAFLVSRGRSGRPRWCVQDVLADGPGTFRRAVAHLGLHPAAARHTATTLGHGLHQPTRQADARDVLTGRRRAWEDGDAEQRATRRVCGDAMARLCDAVPS